MFPIILSARMITKFIWAPLRVSPFLGIKRHADALEFNIWNSRSSLHIEIRD